MQVNDLGLGGVLEIIPKKFGDQRGFFAVQVSKLLLECYMITRSARNISCTPRTRS